MVVLNELPRLNVAPLYFFPPVVLLENPNSILFTCHVFDLDDSFCFIMPPQTCKFF